MAAQVFWTVFHSSRSRQPSQIGPTANFDGAAIPPPMYFIAEIKLISQESDTNSCVLRNT